MRPIIEAASVAARRASVAASPRLFAPIYAKPSFIPAAELHSFPIPRTEVVIANNSGLFFALAAIKKHGRAKHPDVYLVKPEFWLDWLHSDYYDLDWGQSPRGLPWFVRNEFYKIYPYHSEDKNINWRQFQELRKHVLSELYNLGVKIHTGIPAITDQGQYYEIGTNEGPLYLTKNKSFHFYNSLRLPKIDHGIAINGGPISIARSVSELYRYKRKHAPSTCILIGNGRSAVWAAQHFPNTRFIVIGLEQSLALLKDEEVPKNIYAVLKKSDFDEKFILTQSMTDHTMVEIMDINSAVFLYKGKMYCALGFKLKTELTSHLSSNILTIPIAQREEWVAVESLPRGGLMQATMEWAANTENLYWAYEPASYHPTDFMNQVVACLEKSGLSFPLKFFDHLRTKILAKTKELSDEECIDLYKECYAQAYDKKIVSPAAINEFEARLRKAIEERREKYLAADRISPA